VTWQETASPAGLAEAGGAQRGGSAAYAVGQQLWETTDGGASWQPGCFTARLDAVAVMPNGSAVAVGAGYLFRRD
jgi:hypothetical protein